MKLKTLFAGASMLSAISVAQSNNSSPTLLPLTFTPLPLGSITPTGWLHDQLAASASSLAGHQHDFYPYVAQSSWLGGDKEYSALNEGFPYWLNGLVPLAYSLNDSRLIGQVTSAATHVLQHQQEDGWLGPETRDSGARNIWARYPLLLGLVQLVEADAQTWEKPVMATLERFEDLLLAMLRANGTGYLWHEGDAMSEADTTWGRVRTHDLLISLQWWYEREDVSAERREGLAETMRLLIEGAIDWAEWWREGVFIKEDLNLLDTEGTWGPRFPYEHGVNAGQGLKALAVTRRYTHNDTLVGITQRGVNWTFTYHSAATGAILADERLAGLAPFYGSETCTLVETMYSLSYLYQALGDRFYADQCELIAFNALPAQISPDWWARQYVGQPNQGYSRQLDENPFFNTNDWSQTYGVETDYPCCTVNHPQGLPKFLAASFVRVGESGLAHALLGPATVRTALGNACVSIECETAYPFGTRLEYSINASAPFTFYVRVPGWADLSNSSLVLTTSNSNSSSTITIITPLTPDPHTGLHALALPSGCSHITYTLPIRLTTTPRANATISIHAGPLVYALSINSTNTSAPAARYNDPSTPLLADGLPALARDWELRNATPWAVAIEPGTLRLRFDARTDTGAGAGADAGGLDAGFPNPLFAPHAPPTWTEARGCEIDWPIYRGVPGAPPTPVEERVCRGERRWWRFEPVGAAKLRVGDVPVLP